MHDHNNTYSTPLKQRRPQCTKHVASHILFPTRLVTSRKAHKRADGAYDIVNSLWRRVWFLGLLFCYARWVLRVNSATFSWMRIVYFMLPERSVYVVTTIQQQQQPHGSLIRLLYPNPLARDYFCVQFRWFNVVGYLCPKWCLLLVGPHNNCTTLLHCYICCRLAAVDWGLLGVVAKNVFDLGWMGSVAV